MNYCFDVKHAEEYGVDESIMLYNFQFWLNKNKSNNNNFNDGRYWTYNSSRAYAELFPFWNQSKIKRILKSLIDQGVLVKGCYNKNAYDRTNWYAFQDESKFLALSKNGQSIDHEETIKSPPADNQKSESGQPIPDINTDIKSDVKPDTKALADKSATFHSIDKIFLAGSKALTGTEYYKDAKEASNIKKLEKRYQEDTKLFESLCRKFFECLKQNSIWWAQGTPFTPSAFNQKYNYILAEYKKVDTEEEFINKLKNSRVMKQLKTIEGGKK